MIRLKELREETPLNMRQTAAKLNIPYTTYVSYEKGEREPNSEMLIVLANYFNCSIDYLVGRSNERVDEAMLDKALSIDNDLLQKYGNLQDARKAQEQRDKNLTIEQLFAETVSRKEIEHIAKYRELDGYGKKAVDSILDIEHKRCMNKSADETSKPRTLTISRSLLTASAGAGEYLNEGNYEPREFPDTPQARQADVVIPVSGKSMEPLFHDGDELYVRKQPSVEVGEIGIFIKNGEGFVKEAGEDRLISLNPDYDDIYTNGEPIVCFGKVLGKVEGGDDNG